ncbi:PD-(D/E)XK nuclease family protein [Denitratisoma sp. agr-D3]
MLCATRRLAQALGQQYDQLQAGAGLVRWPTLAARTVGEWLAEQAEVLQLRADEAQLSAQPLLQRRPLGGFEERLLWEGIISGSLEDGQRSLFDIAAMAATAKEAHAVAVGWKLPLDGAFASDETRRFLAWRKAFLAACDKAGLVDETRLHWALLALISNPAAVPSLPRHILLAGFDRYTPIEQSLQEICRERGCWVDELDTAHPAVQDDAEDQDELWEREADAGPQRQRAVSYPDTAAECLAAALWARARLADNPQARLGIVVPDLAACRTLIQDTLDDVLAPWAIRPAGAEGARPYNISLGLALHRHPLVATALALLRLVAMPKPIEQGQFSQLLRSPYWSAGGSEADDRARIEAGLRQGVAPKASLRRYLSFATFYGERHALAVPRLLADLDALIQAGDQLPRRKAPSYWAEAFLALLDQGGWLAERTLTSHEYQTRLAFLEETRKLAGLDTLLDEVNAATALKHLTQLCGERVFQPKTQGNPPIQVLGLLETTGLNFDALWVMGMTDAAWPPPARPNPLLPAELQRDRRTPNASATVQLAFAATVQRRLGRSAPEVVFSWPRNEGSSGLRPSPLLSRLLPAEERDAPDSPHWAKHRDPAAFAPPLDDHLAPPVAEGETVQGGTWLLRAQAICPAWAYYQYRLGAKKLETPVEGLDPAQRGSLVHDTLEYFWRQVKTLHALQAMDDDRRRDAVLAAIDAVLAGHDEDPRRESLKPRFRALERQRILRLVMGWLAVELQRPQPFTVVACEESVRVEIEGIAANMQIDRIDQLEDGRLLVIDYKTGAAIDTQNWATERITEPQLPIYAAIAQPADNAIAAVVFAKVLLDDPSFIGLGEEDGLLPKVAGLDSKAGRKLFADSQRFPDWPSVLEHWRQRIAAIAREVKAGEAAVSFSDEKDLRYCDVLPLLRLAERKAQQERAGHES